MIWDVLRLRTEGKEMKMSSVCYAERMICSLKKKSSRIYLLGLSRIYLLRGSLTVLVIVFVCFPSIITS